MTCISAITSQRARLEQVVVAEIRTGRLDAPGDPVVLPQEDRVQREQDAVLIRP